MGVLWSMLGYKCAELRDDDPDPVTTLTSKDKFIIRSSWARIMKNPIENGTAILTLFFEDYPQHKQLFPFRDVPNKELGQNKRFQAHCSAIMYSLTSVVDVVDKPDLLVTILMKIGRDHVPRGVNEQGHLELKTTIVKVFKTLMSEEEMKSWTKAVNVIFDVILKGAGEIKE
ncbi:unnamed protein product [Acanthoscelides obtectus]|uniref:Globin domain-containing protein n=1 Tax=Acanthoscelides obtectus TaxID=200917 RepID=A0A9P0L4B6_ACAOB|nr:unnamed protein product [Acanthoscelides obtectus]CAK1681643.1 hypothetical protein AOBTE_LOCUS33186 [Acanthoscelides obtectus]